MTERIPRKSGQPSKSDKHSDLYTDEDPKGTIQGLKFATPEDAQASVKKIKSSGRSHAHKIQAAIAMEQRAKVMGKVEAAAVYRSFINSMKKKTEDIKEDMAVNNVSSGNIAGTGVGSQGEPGIKKFAGSRVFKVPTKFFINARMMKRKYAKYEEYVGADEVGQQIREYGNSNYGKPIIVQDENTGAMMYLRYGKSI